MSRNAWIVLLLIAAVGVGVGVDRAVSTGQEVATVALSIPILIITVLTLRYTIPQHAKVAVDRLTEAGLTDLIFFIYPQPNPNDEAQQPVDYLFQLHVAVSNVGERKAIISAISVEGFRNGEGEAVHLPDAPEVIGGMRWVQQSGWVNHQMHFQNISDPPPYVLDRDDAIVIRFRVRRGIDWSGRWNVDALRSFTEPLHHPIVAAYGMVVWRRGREVIRERFEVELKVEQQGPYVQLIKELTDDFTVTPRLPEKSFPLE